MADPGYARTCLAAALAFGMTGCVDGKTDFFANDSRFADADCRAIANDRANDAGLIALDEDVQRQVFTRTYADCIDWHRTH
jgi:hypothetical protein